MRCKGRRHHRCQRFYAVRKVCGKHLRNHASHRDTHDVHLLVALCVEHRNAIARHIVERVRRVN